MRLLTVLENSSDTLVAVAVVRVGSIYESTREYGISHLLEHMMFSTKKKKSSAKFLQELSDAGAHYNAFTNYDSTTYFIMGQRQVWKELLDVFRALVFEPPDFTETELQVEIDVVLEELSLRKETPESKGEKGDGDEYDIVTDFFWKGTSYSHGIGGTYSTLKGITKAMLLEYHEKYYRDMAVWVNTPIDISKDVKKHISKTFPKLLPECANMNKRMYDILEIKDNRNAVGIFDSGDRPTSQVLLIFRSLPFEARSVLLTDLLTYSLQGLNGLLDQELRADKGYTYGVPVTNVSFVDNGLYMIQFQTTHDDIVKVVKTFFDRMLRLREEGFSRKAFDGLKRSFMLSEATKVRDPYSLTLRLLQFEFYSGKDAYIQDGLDGYMAFMDKALDYKAFSEHMQTLLRFPGACLFLATPKLTDATSQHVAKAFESFLKH